MRLSLVVLAFACGPAAAITPGNSPALEQAGQIQPTVGSYTYDNARSFRPVGKLALPGQKPQLITSCE